MRLFGNRRAAATEQKKVEKPVQKAVAKEPTKTTVNSKPTDTTSDKLDDVTERRQQLEADIQDLNSQYSDIRTNLKNRLFSEKELLQTHLDQLTKQQAFLQDQQKKASDQLATAQAASQAHAAQKQAVDEEAATLNEQITANKAQIDALESQTAALQTQVKDLDAQQTKIAKHLHSEADLDQLVAVFQQQKQQIEQLTTQKSQLNFKAAELTNQHNQALITKESLANAAEANQQKQTSLAKVGDELSADLEKKGAFAAKINNQLAVVTHQLAESEDQLKDVDTKLTFYFHSAKVIRAFTFNRDRNYYIYSNVLPPLTDLATTSGWQQIDRLFDRMNLRYRLLTTSFDANLGATWRDYQTRQLLPNAGGVVNPYWQLLQRKITMERDVQSVPVDGQWQVTERLGEQPLTLVSPDKQEVAKLQYRRDQSLAGIQYFHNDVLYQVGVFDTNNRLLATQLVDPSHPEKAASATFYDPEGHQVLQKLYLTESPMFQTLTPSGTIQNSYYSDLNFEVEQLKNNVLADETDSLIIGTEAPLFRALLHDPGRHFELIPLVTSDTATDLIEQITRKDSPVSSVLAVDEQVKKTLVDRAERDLNIAVLPVLKQSHGHRQKSNVMTAVQLPKLS